MKRTTSRIMAIVLLLASMCSLASAAVIDCSGCIDCSEKIQGANAGDIVRLTSDLAGCNGNCIDFAGTDGVTFDAENHLITGDGDFDGYGIHLYTDANANTVKNCNITGFRGGLYLFKANNNTIQNITAHYNLDRGITILYSTENRLMDCALYENAYSDFYFRPHVLADCDTMLTNVTGSCGHLIGFYNQSVSLQNQQFAALYLCNADGSNLDNITVRGSSVLKNNEMCLYYTDNSILANITSSHNSEGISLVESYSNVLTDVVCRVNHNNGIFVDRSSLNMFKDVETKANSQCGIYLYHGLRNTITDTVSNYNRFAGIYVDNSPHTTINRSEIAGNINSGVNTNSGDCLIYDNYFRNDRNVNFAGATIHPNDWNVTSTPGLNIIGRSHIGGNYWSDYSGVDNDCDGFGDTPHNLSISNVDCLPLVMPTCGDADQDCSVTIGDVVDAYLRVINPSHPLNSEWAADADGDYIITINDVVEIYLQVINPDHPLNCRLVW